MALFLGLLGGHLGLRAFVLDGRLQLLILLHHMLVFFFVFPQLLLQVIDLFFAPNSIFLPVPLFGQALMPEHIVLFLHLVKRLLQLNHVLLVFLHLGLEGLIF